MIRKRIKLGTRIALTKDNHKNRIGFLSFKTIPPVAKSPNILISTALTNRVQLCLPKSEISALNCFSTEMEFWMYISELILLEFNYVILFIHTLQRWFISTGCNKYTHQPHTRWHRTHIIRNMFDLEVYSLRFITSEKCCYVITFFKNV